MKTIEIKARNYEKAMELAIKETNKSIDELSFECIKEPGLFRQGIYKVIIEEKVEEVAKEPKNSNKGSNKENTKVENSKEEKKPNKQLNQNTKSNNNKVNDKNKSDIVKQSDKKEQQVVKKEEPKQQVVKEKEKEVKKEEKEIKNEHNEEPVKIVADEEKDAQTTQINPAEIDHFIRKFLVEFAKVQGVDVEVECQVRDGNKFYILNGENAHKLIGYHGENLNAMQYIVATIINEKFKSSTRVLLDIEQYKAKREEIGRAHV